MFFCANFLAGSCGGGTFYANAVGSGSGATGPGSGGFGTGTGGVGSGTGGSGNGTGGVGSGTGGSGVSATCGNGQIESGEVCDGSNLNGASCATLGFNSGTLACAASCQYDTSSCSGSLTLTVVPSRTSCAAPCSVFFDATSTTGLQGGDYVISNFTWDFDSTNVDPNGIHRHTVGFVAGHVFDNPGTYQVSVSVRDSGGHAGTTTLPISVTAMTGTTYYVASSGSDQNSGTSMSTPLASVSAALKKAATQTSILFRRGDTFNLGSGTITVSAQGPWLVGAYSDPASPSTAAPILNSTIADALINVTNGSDTRLVDLHIKSKGSSNAITVTGSPYTLVERLEIEGIGSVDSSNQTTGDMFYTETKSTPSFFVDSNLHDFMGYGFYGATVNKLAIIGNTIQRFGGGDHGVRIAGGALSYVAENTIMSNDTNTALSAITVRGDDQNMVVTGNHVNRIIEFTPQNTMSVEHVINGLADGNLINDARTTGFYPYALGITGQHIVARNNILVNAPIGIEVFGQPQLPINFVDQIYLYNNTSYFFPVPPFPASYGTNFMALFTTTGTVIAENNIFAEGETLTGVQTNFLQTDNMGKVTEDHNLSFAPNVKGTWTPATGTADIVGDPKFASTSVTDANAFSLSAGSPAIDKGTSVPVFQDFGGVVRPSGAGWDIGARELQQ